HFLHGGHQQADEYRDDGDHHQQFDQREAAARVFIGRPRRPGGTLPAQGPARQTRATLKGSRDRGPSLSTAPTRKSYFFPFPVLFHRFASQSLTSPFPAWPLAEASRLPSGLNASP